MRQILSLGLKGIKMANKNNEYYPNDKHQKMVDDLSRCGVPQHIIADSIGISENTMIKYYGDLLREGQAAAVTGAAKSLYQKVMNGDNASLFFYLKTRAGYKETAVQENRYVDSDGKDLHQKDKEILENAGISTN